MLCRKERNVFKLELHARGLPVDEDRNQKKINLLKTFQVCSRKSTVD